MNKLFFIICYICLLFYYFIWLLGGQIGGSKRLFDAQLLGNLSLKKLDLMTFRKDD